MTRLALGGVGSRVRWPEFREVLFVLSLLAVVAVYRWAVLSGEAAPPGSDGGNWLAFGAELFDDDVKAASAAYPPFFPILVQGFVAVMSPLAALKLLGILSGAMVGLGAYLLLRRALPWVMAGALAAALSMSDYQTEVLAWGGYPQLLGAAFLLVALFLLLRGLHTGRMEYFMGSAVAAALTVATHLLAAYLLIPTMAVAMAAYCYGWVRSLSWEERRRRLNMVLLWGVATVVLALVTVPFYVRMVEDWAGIPANPQGINMLRLLGDLGSWRTVSYMWLVVGIGGVPAVLWSVYRRKRMLLAEGALALVVASLVGLLVQNEVRSIHLLEVGLLLSAGVALAMVLDSQGQRILRMSRQGAVYAAFGLAVVLVSGVAYFGVQRSDVAFDWYRVIDDEALEAMEWMQVRGGPEDRVVANETPRGGIYGWWVEGYAGLPTYFAVDTRWLSFKSEKDQAAVAHRMLSPDTTPQELSRLAEENGIRFLFLDKRTLSEPRPRFEEAGFELGIEAGSVIVFTYQGQGGLGVGRDG